MPAKDLAKFDIIFTTYATVFTEFQKWKGEGALFARNWFRIILDEG